MNYSRFGELSQNDEEGNGNDNLTLLPGVAATCFQSFVAFLFLCCTDSEDTFTGTPVHIPYFL